MSRCEIRVEDDGKEKKVFILNTCEWATWEADPNERDWIKLLAMKQGYEIIQFNNKELWRRDGKILVHRH